MKVKELIRTLKQFDENLEIMFWSNGNGSGYEYENKLGIRIQEEEICTDIEDGEIYLKDHDYDSYLTLQGDILETEGRDMTIDELYDIVDEKWENEDWEKTLIITLYN